MRRYSAFLLAFLLFISCARKEYEEDRRTINMIKAEKDNFSRLLEKGNAYLMMKKYGLAKLYYEEAEKVNGTDPVVHFNLGLVWDEMGKLDKAAESYTRAIELDRTYVKALLNLGLVFLKKKDYVSALKYFNDTLLYSPDNKLALFNKALVLHKTSPERALDAWYDFYEAAKNDPSQYQNVNRAIGYIEALEKKYGSDQSDLQD